MFGIIAASGGTGTLTFVTSATGTGGATVTTQSGDIVILAQYNNSSTIPTLVSGYTDIRSDAYIAGGSGSIAGRISYRKVSATSESVSTTAASTIMIVVRPNFSANTFDDGTPQGSGGSDPAAISVTGPSTGSSPYIMIGHYATRTAPINTKVASGTVNGSNILTDVSASTAHILGYRIYNQGVTSETVTINQGFTGNTTQAMLQLSYLQIS